MTKPTYPSRQVRRQFARCMAKETRSRMSLSNQTESSRG